MRIRYFVQTFAMAMICVGAAMLAHAQSASGNTNQSCVVGVQMTDWEYGLKVEPGNATIGLHPRSQYLCVCCGGSYDDGRAYTGRPINHSSLYLTIIRACRIL